MLATRFERGEAQNAANEQKHGVSFFEAQFAFADPLRVIARDLEHGGVEQRFYGFGSVSSGVLTVRFTFRCGVIKIFGAG